MYPIMKSFLMDSWMNLELWASFFRNHILAVSWKIFFQTKGNMSLVVATFYLFSFNTRLTSADRHFCHFRCFVQSFHRPVVLPPHQAKPGLHLVLHILLADKDDKHEEAAEQVEAVDDPEEDLDVVGVAAEPVRVVGVEDVVDGGEYPEDSQDQE